MNKEVKRRQDKTRQDKKREEKRREEKRREEMIRDENRWTKMKRDDQREFFSSAGQPLSQGD